MSNERDNFKAGLFVIGGVLLMLLAVFQLADFRQWFEKQQQVQVFFALDDGLQGLKEHAAVTLGDQPVGSVTAIEDSLENGRVIAKLVRLTIPERYQLHQDAVLELVVPPLGSGTRLNIRSVGSGQPYREGDVLRGELAGSVLTENLARHVGIQEQQRRQIQAIIANIEQMTGAFTAKDESGQTRIDTIVTDLQRTMADLPELTADLKTILAEAQAAVHEAHETLKTVRELAGQIQDSSGDWIARINQISEDAQQTMTTVRALMRDKDPNIRHTLENLDQITTTVREQTLAQVTEALGKADEALENVRQATAQLQAFTLSQRPVLESAIANAQITTGQLKLAAIEVRRSPWRLMYKPSDKELDSDNLYDAARSFALAAGTLEAAAQSLRAVAQSPTAADQEQVDQILDHLEAIFGRFEEAEGAFWAALKQNGKP